MSSPRSNSISQVAQLPVTREPRPGRPPFELALTEEPASAARRRPAQLLAELLAAPPAWLQLEDGLVDETLLRRVPVGPTLLLGFGGSALGARAALAIAEAAGLQPGPLRILDSVDPWVVADALDWAESRDAKLCVVSKSGRTIEVLTLLEACLGRGLAPATLISDPPAEAELSPIRARLRQLASAPLELELPAAVGGRWSVFTAVGQAPLRAAGLEPRLLVDAAIAERTRLGEAAAREPLERSLAWRLAAAAPHALVWCYSEALLPYAAWLQQLECESLGRQREDGSRVGELLCPLRGPADQHSVAQLLLDGPQIGRVTFLDFDDRPDQLPQLLAELGRLRIVEREATRMSMTLPTRQLLIRDRHPSTLAALMLFALLETAVTAAALGVSPYGQPAVERIKRGIRARR